MPSQPFVHLHCHSHYSLLDGASKIPNLVKRAKALGMPALAVTDHGNLHGAVEFLREAKAADFKPILGMEAYVAPFGRREKTLGGHSGKEHNFDQHITDADDLIAYDYGSIMHYGATAFSKNGQPTLQTLGGQSIGQRKALSTTDVSVIGKLYP